MKTVISSGLAMLLLAAGTAHAQAIHTVSFVHKAVDPGTVRTIGGKDFVLVRLPMADFGSADRYIVEFMAEIYDPGPPPSFLANLETEHSNETLVDPVLIDGFPANIRVSDSREYRFGTSFNFPGNSLTVNALVFGIVRVKVGGTMITFQQPFFVEQQAETAAAPSAPYSGSPSGIAKWSSYVDPTAQVTALDDWIDYIRILKVN